MKNCTKVNNSSLHQLNILYHLQIKNLIWRQNRNINIFTRMDTNCYFYDMFKSHVKTAIYDLGHCKIWWNLRHLFGSLKASFYLWRCSKQNSVTQLNGRSSDDTVKSSNWTHSWRRWSGLSIIFLFFCKILLLNLWVVSQMSHAYVSENGSCSVRMKYVGPWSIRMSETRWLCKRCWSSPDVFQESLLLRRCWTCWERSKKALIRWTYRFFIW